MESDKAEPSAIEENVKNVLFKKKITPIILSFENPNENCNESNDQKPVGKVAPSNIITGRNVLTNTPECNNDPAPTISKNIQDVIEKINNKGDIFNSHINNGSPQPQQQNVYGNVSYPGPGTTVPPVYNTPYDVAVAKANAVDANVVSTYEATFHATYQAITGNSMPLMPQLVPSISHMIHPHYNNVPLHLQQQFNMPQQLHHHMNMPQLLQHMPLQHVDVSQVPFIPVDQQYFASGLPSSYISPNIQSMSQIPQSNSSTHNFPIAHPDPFSYALMPSLGTSMPSPQSLANSSSSMSNFPLASITPILVPSELQLPSTSLYPPVPSPVPPPLPPAVPPPLPLTVSPPALQPSTSNHAISSTAASVISTSNSIYSSPHSVTSKAHVSSKYAPASSSNYAPASSSNYAPVSSSNYAPASSSNYAPASSSNYAPASSSNYAPSCSFSSTSTSNMTTKMAPAPAGQKLLSNDIKVVSINNIHHHFFDLTMKSMLSVCGEIRGYSFLKPQLEKPCKFYNSFFLQV